MKSLTSLYDWKNLPKQYQCKITDDGSPCVYSGLYNEDTHSSSGAWSETLVHFINGLSIPKEILWRDIKILDVGFGIGLNVLAVFLEQQKLPKEKRKHISVVSLEIDFEIAQWAMGSIFSSHTSNNQKTLTYEDEDFSLKVLIGDAKKSLLNSKEKGFDFVFQDAFSPKNTPSLWSKDWFSLLGSRSSPNSRLSTYSTASEAIYNMHQSGWGVSFAKGFGRKKGATRAIWGGKTEEKVLEKFEKMKPNGF